MKQPTEKWLTVKSYPIHGSGYGSWQDFTGVTRADTRSAAESLRGGRQFLKEAGTFVMEEFRGRDQAVE